jgi:hypothetical protein
VKFETPEEFELHVHKCFDKIFDLLLKVDSVVKTGAEKEEQDQNCGVMCDLRDWIEETILYCHLAWQYHRLAQGPRSSDTWDQIEESNREPESGT